MTVSETASLTLREFETGDWHAVHDYAVDPEVVRFMPWGPNTEAETRAFIGRVMNYRREDPRKQYELAVVLRSDDRLIGACGIHTSSEDAQRGWIGYCLNHAYWGNGYATQVARALISLGFEQLGFRKIVATCDPENTASARVLDRVGMRFEDHIKKHVQINGQWRDSLRYVIALAEFRTGA